MKNETRIAFGGGCHWCTEAVFQSIIGVEKVEQGYVASIDDKATFSEAVIVNFNTECVNLNTLIEIHLLTHNSTSNHSMRSKYRSAIYTFDDFQNKVVKDILAKFQVKFDNKLITEVLPFKAFRPSREAITNYYYKNPTKPFCEMFINPKLRLFLNKFSHFVNMNKMEGLNLALDKKPSQWS